MLGRLPRKVRKGLRNEAGRRDGTIVVVVLYVLPVEDWLGTAQLVAPVLEDQDVGGKEGHLLVHIGDPVEHVCVHLGDHRQFRVLEDRLGRHGSLCEFRHKGTATAILLHLPHVVLRAPQDRQEHGTGMRAMCGEGGKFRSGAHQGWRHSRPFSCILAERDVVE